MLKHSFKGLLAAAALVCTAWTASAVDLGEIELGQTYDLSAYNFQTVTATFTAPTAGEYYLDGGDFDVFSDEAYTTSVHPTSYLQNNNNGLYTFNLAEGAKYYLKAGFLMGSTYLKVYRDVQLELDHANPEIGSTLISSGYPQVDFWFNIAISTVENVTLTAAGETFSPTWRLVNDRIVTIEIKEILNQLYTADKLHEGDAIDFSFKLADKDGNLYHGDGLFEASYVAGRKSATLVSAVMPPKFLSYFAPGQASSLVKLTFDSELSTTRPAQLRLGFGNVEYEGEYYTETIDGVVDGCSVTFDLSGKRRIPAEMVASGTDYGIMALMCGPFYDTQDQYVYSSGQGKMGSMDYALAYEQLAPAEIYSQFTPENGTSLSGTDQIEIWVRTMASFSYDGVKITYDDAAGQAKACVIPQAELAVEYESFDDSAIITFALPAAVKAGKNVVVTLNDFVAFDGYDHDGDVMATYNAFVLTYAEPANGSHLAALATGEVIKVCTNYSTLYPEMYMMYEIRDLNAADEDAACVKAWSFMTRTADASYEDGIVYTSEMLYDQPLYSGHAYAINYRAWATEDDFNYMREPVGDATVTLYGTSAEPRYSDVKFVSIDPANGTVLADASQRVFTVTYDGMVALTENTHINLGYGMTMAFESLEGLDGENGYAPVWKLTVPQEYMESLANYLEFSVGAVDMDGNAVEAEMGNAADSYFVFEYPVGYNKVELAVAPDPAEDSLLSLHTFTFTDPAGGEVMPSYDELTATLTGEQGLIKAWVNTEIDTWDDNNVVLDASGWMVIGINLNLDAELTEAGSYVLSVPDGYFTVGDNQAPSAACELTYIIGTSGIDAAFGEPTAVYTVYNAAGILLMRAADRAALRALAPGLYIINSRKYIIR